MVLPPSRPPTSTAGGKPPLGVLRQETQHGSAKRWVSLTLQPLSHTHTHACTHARAHTHTHTRTHVRTHARTHTRMYARTHTHTHTHTDKQTHGTRTQGVRGHLNQIPFSLLDSNLFSTNIIIVCCTQSITESVGGNLFSIPILSAGFNLLKRLKMNVVLIPTRQNNMRMFGTRCP